jgi:hypothetical protein
MTSSPTALTTDEQRLILRATGGNVRDAAVDQMRCFSIAS